MKKICVSLVAFAAAAMMAAPSHAQTTQPKRRTVWVAPKTGSLIGGGYVDAGDVDTAGQSSITSARVPEDPTLRAAVIKLDSHSDKTVEGYGLLFTAVSLQTKVPVATLKRQRAATGMSPGELLVANSLAAGSGKSFEAILAMRSKNRGWASIARDLRINPKSIIARANKASESMLYAEDRRRHRREQNMNDSDFQRPGRTRDPRGN